MATKKRKGKSSASKTKPERRKPATAKATAPKGTSVKKGTAGKPKTSARRRAAAVAFPEVLAPNLKEMQAQRTLIRDLHTEMSANATQLVQLERQRKQSARTGATATQLNKLDTQIAKLREKHGSLADQLVMGTSALGSISNQLAADLSPEQLVATLDGGVPVVFLPARLETRFFKNDTELQIRVYPDQAHTNGHEPDLTEAELAAGKWYWEQRSSDPTSAGSAWESLVKSFGARRSSWIVLSLQPGSPSQPGIKAEAWTKPVQAVALPDRWVAIGYQGTTEVFRKWGRGVPDALPVSLTPDPADLAPEPPADELPIDEGLRWTVDYKQAEELGMAITVTDADLGAGRKLRNGLTRLIVFGVDWTLKPDQAANALADLLIAHQYNDGFEFLKPGVATNNTGATRAGFNETDSELAKRYDPAAPPAGGAPGTASQLLMWALGLDPARISLDRVPGAALREQRITSNLLNVLWRGTLGYYLDEMLNVDGDAADSDPLIGDATLDQARTHVKAFLFPGGPLPTLRIAKQPYGVLPVVVNFRPATRDTFSGRLLAFLNKLRPFWVYGLKEVPRVVDVTSREVLDDKLLRILQTTPLASTARFRRVIGSATSANTQGLTRYEGIQADVSSQILGPHFGWHKPPRITGFVTDPRSYNLPVPWVQAGTVSDTERVNPNYFEGIAGTLRGKLGPDARAALMAQEDADNLLQSLLALAAVEEIDYCAHQLVYLHHEKIGRAEKIERAPGLRIAETLFTEQLEARASSAAVQTANVYSPSELSQVILPSVTNDQTLGVYITAATRDRALLRQPQFADLSSFLTSLDVLTPAFGADVERAFRGVLDAYSHRLDAWYTSLAMRRLTEQRNKRALGLHIGGYGWVENLQPESRPDSLGYVHAPSIPQAVTAALLRSAHLSHQTGENAPGQAPFNIDLSSARVRIALEVINGVARGQPLAALLGYRFERNLREFDISLAKFILPFRRLFPLRPNPETLTAGTPVESIAARDVVDAVNLLERWRKDKRNLFTEKLITDENPTGPQLDKLARLLDELADILDAASDVLVAESVYQMVIGNYERSNAATAALDRQERAVAPDVVRTPRTGKGYAQRVMVLMNSSTPPVGWTGINDECSRAEPRANAWVASLLGDPKRIQIAARVFKKGKEGESPKEQKPLSLKIDALGVSPLSLAFLAAPGGHQRPSELEERLVMQFVTLVQNPDENTIIELVDTPPANAPANAFGLGELRALLDWIRALISDRRPADARDLALPEELPGDGVDPAELVGRVAQLKTKLSEALKALQDASKAPALRSALKKASALNAPNALPLTILDDAESVAELRKQADEARDHLQRVQAEVTKAETDIAGKNLSDAQKAAHLTGLIKLVLGKAFPVLAPFRAVNAAELKISLAEQAALTGNDNLAPIGWLRKMGLVRPSADALVSVLSGASLLGSPAADPSTLALVQLPHQTGQRWQALSFAEGQEPDGEIAILAHTFGKLDPTKPLAGFVCDEWLEMIPNANETTGLSFHYDAPGARPPQVVILAVPPELEMQNWNFQALVDTINETFNLGKLRAVGPKELQILGGWLPAVYLPNNFTKDVPTTDLLKLRAKYVTSVVAGGVLGKEILKGN